MNDRAPESPRAVGDEILERLKAAMLREALDAILPMSPENLAYASGAAPPSQRTVRERLAAAIIPSAGDTEVVTVGLEAPLVRGQSRLDRVTPYEEFVEHPIDVVARSLVERGLGDGRIGLEETYLSHADFERLRAALPDAELRPIDAMLSRQRTLKTPGEIERLGAIARSVERLHEECLEAVGPGDSESDLARAISESFHARGGDALTMLVVASGPRSALPNGPPTDRRLERGDVVRIDVIGTHEHYYVDIARTATVGPPTDEQRRVYELLHSVRERCVDALRPGASSADVYRIYKDAMERAGLPAYHFVGHGLGVTLHEEPFVNELFDAPLEAGMVLCIEPLTFVEGRFGMQVEDEIVVVEDGCVPLSIAGAMGVIGD